MGRVSNAVHGATERNRRLGPGNVPRRRTNRPGTSYRIRSRGRVARAGAAMMRVFGHVDDGGLPVETLSAALIRGRDSLTLVSDHEEIVDDAEIESTQTSKLFAITRDFHGSCLRSSTFDIDAVAGRLSTALIVTRKDFLTPGWRASPGLGWIMSDLPAPELRRAMMLAIHGSCLVPSEFFSVQGSAKMDHRRIGSMRPRDCAILMQIGRGMSDNAIARELGISTIEVRKLITNLYDKLSVTSRAEAGAFCVRFRDQVVAHRRRLINDTEDYLR